MAFDGITVAALVRELNNNILNGRISKIAQPEIDEVMLTIKSPQGGQRRLLISASASLPLVYFTDNNKQSPMTAPAFCMLLRKHIANGKILSITQPGLERIINIEIEHLDEMGDLKRKTLIIELMGKHSNIIFINEEGIIIDAIKHIPSSVSSVREVLPGKEYFIPNTEEKKNPLETTPEEFEEIIISKAMPVYKALYMNYTGLSPFFANELCHRAGIDGDSSTAMLAENNYCFGNTCDGKDGLHNLTECFFTVVSAIKNGDFHPVEAYENSVPYEYAALELTGFDESDLKSFDSMSSLIESFYEEKAFYTRMRQKSVDLRKIVDTVLERDIRKYDLQLKQMEDTEKKDKYRIYGELLNTYGYSALPGAKDFKCLNYYTNEDIIIPLDPTLSALENAQKYFEKYNKLKRTREALEKLTIEVKEEIDHLESLSNALDIASSEDDLIAIKEEMIEGGYVKRHDRDKKPKLKSKPLHYMTKEGFHIFVGKNNLQNEEITFKLANSNDWWFHAKKIPGSHVVVRTEGKELPDSVFEDAARLAAHYSKANKEKNDGSYKGNGQNGQKVEVDYVRRKEVKHPNGSKPGFVVYYTNYSMVVDTNISGITLVTE